MFDVFFEYFWSLKTVRLINFIIYVELEAVKRRDSASHWRYFIVDWKTKITQRPAWELNRNTSQIQRKTSRHYWNLTQQQKRYLQPPTHLRTLRKIIRPNWACHELLTSLQKINCSKWTRRKHPQFLGWKGSGYSSVGHVCQKGE